MTAIETRQLAGALGVEIGGIDLSRPLGEQQRAALRAAFTEHKVLAFRDQDLDPQSLFAFSGLWGEPYHYPHMTGLEEQPEVFEIYTAPHARRVFGNRWHSDQMYTPEPVKVTMLYARELPPVDGDTIFSNTETAHDALSAGLKAMLSGLRIHCDSADRARYGGLPREEWYAGGDMDRKLNEGAEKQLIGVHPLIRTHPETGRKCLYIGDQAQRFDGMTEDESKPLIDYLMTHIQRPEFTCRVRWAPGTLVLWDNRCTCHYAVADYVGHARRMHRVTIAGDAPF